MSSFLKKTYKNSLLEDVEYDSRPAEINGEAVIYFFTGKKEFSRKINISKYLSYNILGYVKIDKIDYDILYLIGTNQEIVCDIVDQTLLKCIYIYLESRGDKKILYNGNYLYFQTYVKDIPDETVHYLKDDASNTIVDIDSKDIKIYNIEAYEEVTEFFDKEYINSLLEEVSINTLTKKNPESEYMFYENMPRMIFITPKKEISVIAYILKKYGEITHLYLISTEFEIIYDILDQTLNAYLLLYLRSKGPQKVFYNGNYLYYKESNHIRGKYFIYDENGDLIEDSDNNNITISDISHEVGIGVEKKDKKEKEEKKQEPTEEKKKTKTKKTADDSKIEVKTDFIKIQPAVLNQINSPDIASIKINLGSLTSQPNTATESFELIEAANLSGLETPDITSFKINFQEEVIPPVVEPNFELIDAIGTTGFDTPDINSLKINFQEEVVQSPVVPNFELIDAANLSGLDTPDINSLKINFTPIASPSNESFELIGPATLNGIGAPDVASLKIKFS